jgi:hypothetical protein
MRIILEDKEDALDLERIPEFMGLNSSSRIAVRAACPVMTSNLVSR